MNTLLKTDSYKGEHWAWINKDVDFATGYLEPRLPDATVQVAGIAALVLDLAQKHIITNFQLGYFQEFAKAHSFGHAQINMEGWQRIVDEFGGKIPVEIKSLAEGSVVPTRVPIFMVRNTVAGFAWVVPYFELLWLHTWKTMSVATSSFSQMKLLRERAKGTMPDEMLSDWADYALHDFGARSTGSMEEATIGVGHLLNSKGSDNWPATAKALEAYTNNVIPSNSVLALEHNVVLSHGEDQEHALFAEFAEYVLTQGRVGSMLIDTYDVDKAVDWVIENKELLTEWAEVGNGKLVLRPDSGDPTEMPVGILEKLLANFPITEYNGYKLLPSWLGIIQGDGNNLRRLAQTTQRLLEKKISLANIVFGEGGELINNYTRDGLHWAFKVSMLTLKDGTEVPCAKKPKDSPEKHSKEGYFSYVDGNLFSADSWDEIVGYESVVKNGIPQKEFNLQEIRAHALTFMEK